MFPKRKNEEKIVSFSKNFPSFPSPFSDFRRNSKWLLKSTAFLGLIFTKGGEEKIQGHFQTDYLSNW